MPCSKEGKMIRAEAIASLSDEFLGRASRVVDSVWPGQSEFFRRDMDVQAGAPDIFDSFCVYATDPQTKEMTGIAVCSMSMLSTELRTITWFAVVPSMQGNGFGTMIIKACLDHPSTINKDVILGTGRPNLFASLGFQEAGRYTAHRDRHLMLLNREPRVV